MDGGATKAELSWKFAYAGTSDTRPKTASYSVSYDSGCSAATKTFENTCAPLEESENMPHVGQNSFKAGGGGACTYDYATHGDYPVVTSAQCTITSADLDHGTEPGSRARAYVRKLGGHDSCDDDDAGHILANQLGGKAEPTNLFPQSPHLNRGAWERFEKAIRSCMDGGATKAELSWKFAYAGTSDARPKTASYSVSYDSGCSAATKTFDNTCAPVEESENIRYV
jgi:hypothetical protein